MPKKRIRSDAPAQPFRHSAEQQWKVRHRGARPQDAARHDAAVYELEVHQIELELQNEELRDTQLQLTDARDNYRDLYDFAPVGYLTLDQHRVIRRANQTAAKLLGVEQGKLLGMRIERFAMKESRDQLYLHLNSVRAAEGRACGLFLHRGDGTPFYAHVECTMADVALADDVSYRIALTDISALHEAQQALRQSERRFRALTEKAADYVSIMDVRGTVIYESPSANRTLDFAAGELVGRNAFERVHPDDLSTVRRLFDELVRRPGHSVNAEIRVRARDGAWRWLEVVGTNLLDDPAVRGIVTNSRDVTDRKQALEELRQANELLDRRVCERTAAIELLNDVASMANRAQDFKQAIDYALRRLTAYDGWCVGYALLPAQDDPRMLRSACFCQTDGERRFARFLDATAATSFRIGKGLLGRAFSQRKPAWSTKLRRDLIAPRGALAEELGLATAVAFPVLVGEKVAAVLELFSAKSFASEEQFTEIMVSVGIQLGRVIERANFEERLLSIADEIQQRIAQDLHDDLGQELTGLGLKAETLSEALRADGDRSCKLAADVLATVETAREKVRSLARRILPVELELGSLTGALEGLAASTTAGSRAKCTFRNSHPNPCFEGRVAAHLYRIAQESVSNAIRHGEPRHIRIDLACKSGRTELGIEDDGAGLSAEDARGKGLGLQIMRYRAELIGGTLDIGPARPHGTRVCCRLPTHTDPSAVPRRRKKK